MAEKKQYIVTVITKAVHFIEGESFEEMTYPLWLTKVTLGEPDIVRVLDTHVTPNHQIE